jgi:hypothetical protein
MTGAIQSRDTSAAAVAGEGVGDRDAIVGVGVSVSSDQPAGVGVGDGGSETEETIEDAAVTMVSMARPSGRVFVKEPEPLRKVAEPQPKYAASEPAMPVIDLSDVVAGTRLKHKVFGEGAVVEIGGGRIIVAFGAAEKKFIVPDAFVKGFLRKG